MNSDNRSLHYISFDRLWKPTKKFKEVFELVDDAGNVVQIATPQITKYRFKKGMENWGSTTMTTWMFFQCYALIFIELPSNWGNVNDTSFMFFGCRKLTTVKLPQEWGNVTATHDMFEGCVNLENITLPSDWGKVVNINGMFSYCPKLPFRLRTRSWIEPIE